jgi:hypothetical protein
VYLRQSMYIHVDIAGVVQEWAWEWLSIEVWYSDGVCTLQLFPQQANHLSQWAVTFTQFQPSLFRSVCHSDTYKSHQRESCTVSGSILCPASGWPASFTQTLALVYAHVHASLYMCPFLVQIPNLYCLLLHLRGHMSSSVLTESG